MKYKKILIVIIISIFIVIFSKCTYLIIMDLQELKENNESTENLIEESIEMKKEAKEKYLDWNYLKSINEDIIGWIEIEGTNINYPILKDMDNYYLKHSFDNKYNNNGSIFTTNLFPFIDDETIIYGHNMKNGSMFSTLGNYLNEDFLYSHNKFKIYTPNCNYNAIIFSVYSIDIEKEYKNIKSLNFDEKINYYKSVSKYNIKNEADISKIVKLSTCSYINAKKRPTEQRYYIVANLISL